MIRALSMARPQGADTPQRVARARVWLVSNPARTTTDKVYRLLGLHWSDADRNTVHDAAQALLDEQDETGGWAQLPGLNPDAYATGLALVALREAEAFTPSQSDYRRGVRFLVRTQQSDGSWARRFVQSVFRERVSVRQASVQLVYRNGLGNHGPDVRVPTRGEVTHGDASLKGPRT